MKNQLTLLAGSRTTLVSNIQGALVTTEDVLFTFKEPLLLEVETKNTEVDCQVGDNARAEVLVEGGIAPYSFEWSTGESTARIENLSPGKYFVVVTDARGCRAEGNVRIDNPSKIRLKVLTQNNPGCNNGTNGIIEVAAKGGVPPYTYEWNNGILGSSLSGIPAGEYTVTITDSNLKNNRCVYEETFELINPEEIPIDLGEDRTLCAGQVLDLDISISDTSATYLWENNHGFRSTNPVISIFEAGIYTATILSGLGCSSSDPKVSDTITIAYSDQSVNAEFLIATTAKSNKEIALVNVSDPRPEKIDWTIPEGVEVVTKDNDLVTLIFKEGGNYTLGMRAFQGDCYADHTKQIFVEEGEVSAADFIEEGDFIKDVIVFPNPNDGVFKVKIDLQREASAELRLMSLINGEVMDKIVTTSKKEHLVDYNLNISSGSYILIVETKFGNAIRKVVMN